MNNNFIMKSTILYMLVVFLQTQMVNTCQVARGACDENILCCPDLSCDKEIFQKRFSCRPVETDASQLALHSLQLTPRDLIEIKRERQREYSSSSTRYESTTNYQSSKQQSPLSPSYQSSQSPSFESWQRPWDQSSQNPSYQSSQSPSYQSSQNPPYQPSQNPSYQSSLRPAFELSQSPSYQSSQNPSHQALQSPSYQSSQSPTERRQQDQQSPISFKEFKQWLIRYDPDSLNILESLQ